MSSQAEVYYLRRIGSLTVREAADLCGVSVRSWQRYETGQTPIPKPVYKLLVIHTTGQLPATIKQWTGWRFIRNQLWSPENIAFDPGEIRAIPYLHAIIAELRTQLGQPSLDINPWKNNNVIPFRKT